MASQCTFGYFTGKTCHVTTYCSNTGLISNTFVLTTGNKNKILQGIYLIAFTKADTKANEE